MSGRFFQSVHVRLLGLALFATAVPRLKLRKLRCSGWTHRLVVALRTSFSGAHQFAS
jgi:hypothetical protein